MTPKRLAVGLHLLVLFSLANRPLAAQDSLPPEVQPIVTRLHALASAQEAYYDRWDMFTSDLTSLVLDPVPEPARADSVAVLITFASASGWIGLGWVVSHPYRQCVIFAGYGEPAFLPDPPATSAGTLATEEDDPVCDE